MSVRILFALLLLVAAGRPASAVTMYTSDLTFYETLAGLSGTETILNFDLNRPGGIVNSGDTIDGITFNYSYATGDLLRITDTSEAGQATTSGTQFLGTNFAGNFNLIEDAEGFDLGFSAPTIAIGLYFTTIDEILDGDFQLITSEGTAVNAAAASALLSDGFTRRHFVGLIADNPFSSAQIRTCGSDSGCGGFFLYGVDDIVAVEAVPEPATVSLLAFGLLGFVWSQKKKRQVR